MVHYLVGIPAKTIRNINPVSVSEKYFSETECNIIRKSSVINDSGKRPVAINLKNLTSSIIEKLVNHIHQVNSSIYNFQLSYIGDMFVLNHEKAENFDWHMDIGKDEFSTTRKFSVIVFLSDKGDYRGGSFKIFENEKKNSYSNEQGTIIIFPAFHIYGFEPVISGKRTMLITWAYGPAFK